MTSRFQKTFVKDKPELDKFNEPISNNTINITKGVGDKQSSLSQNFGSSVTNGFNSSCDNLKVVIRVRPALSREIDDGLPFRSIVLLSNENKSINLVEYLGAELTEKERQREWIENPNLFQLHRFSFDHAFDMDATQQEVYEVTAKPAIMSVLEGYNSTVFAYGQTGTGKTYTMEGFTYSSSDMNRGIIQRSIEEIFNYIEQFSNSNTKFMVRAGYIQIYNEMISDLLKSEKTNLQIREDKKKGVYVEGQSEWAVRTPSDIYALLKRGASSRATSFTMMNDVSSRSHAVFRITVEQMTIVENSKSQVTQIKVGKLNLVDLAGSERIRVTGAKGKQLEESKNINKSLSALGNVIYALTDTKGRTHIPYRDSKLTRLLEDSLGGNCKTTMMAMISPSHVSFNESLSTLHFARRAKNIKNKPKINEDLDQKALIRQYEDELKKLRSELEQKNKLISTNNIMTSLNCSNMSEMEIFSQLEEQKKRAEEDKNLAILALEQASKQYLQERDEKKRLESKISLMNSQMLVGGTKIEDTPQFRTALEEKQSVLLREFDLKLQEFEKERQQVEEGKAQVEKYRQLLLKQRDIMIALTTKLNERDEMIVQFQDEIDAYDKINKEQEDLISNKSDRVSILEKLLRRSNLPVPDEIMNAQHSYCKNSSRYQDNKLYIPFEVEQNQAEYENKPVSMLTSDEKVKELTYIIKEQEKEVSVLRILSQRLINQANESNPNQSQNFAEAYTRDRNNVESHTKINLLESEKSLLTKSLEEKDDLINFVRQENETLNEQYYSLEAKLKEVNKVKQGLTRIINTDIKNMFDSLNLSIEKSNPKSAKELSYIYRYLNECVQSLQEYNDPNDHVFDSNNNSNFQNYYFDEESSRTDKGGKASSYITQNYEKFKQQQTTEKVELGQSQNSAINSQSNQESFLTAKSSIIKNLASRTPNKSELGSQSYKEVGGVSVNNQQHRGSVNIQSSVKPQINPNPISSHLKSGSMNDRLVNKFMSK